MSEQTQKQVGNGHANQLSPEMASYMYNMQMLQQIASHMREIPVLESEKPTDTNALLKVEFPIEGGVLTYMENHPYPYRGFPLFENVDKIDTIKKLSKAMLSGFYHSAKKRRFTLIFMLPLLFVARDMLFTGVYTFHRLIERFKIRSDKYSQSVRALYKAFDTPRHKEDIKMLELRLMLKDVACMLLELDNAYRYRFQDVVAELDQQAVKANPVKELVRLLDLMVSRENTQEVRDTWKLVKMGVKYYLRFDRSLKKMLADVLSTLDLKEIELTLEDKHFAGLRRDYKFKFKN